MNSNPRFGFLFTVFPLYDLDDINDFKDKTWHCSGYGYGETEREAISNACKDCYRDATLWNVPRDPWGYLVEFYEDGNVESVEKKKLHLVCETTYSVEFDNEDKETFFKATN